MAPYTAESGVMTGYQWIDERTKGDCAVGAKSAGAGNAPVLIAEWGAGAPAGAGAAAGGLPVAGELSALGGPCKRTPSSGLRRSAGPIQIFKEVTSTQLVILN